MALFQSNYEVVGALDFVLYKVLFASRERIVGRLVVIGSAREFD